MARGMRNTPIPVERKAYFLALDGLMAIMAVSPILENPSLPAERERFLTLTFRRGEESALVQNVGALYKIGRGTVFPTIARAHPASQADVTPVIYPRFPSGV